jgi:hypothetical protein
MADDAPSPVYREMWLELAADWLSVASIYERHRRQMEESEAKH